MMRPLITATLALIVLGSAGTAEAQRLSSCERIADPTARAACYERMPVPPGVTIGHNERPTAPGDQAFDPRSQQVAAQHLGTVEPVLRPAGRVPVASGPGSSVPVVTAELASLWPVPGGTWQLSLALANNSARTIDAQLLCSFLNANRPAADVTVLMRGVRGGDRVTTDVAGPPVTTFVDNATCRVLSPLE